MVTIGNLPTGECGVERNLYATKGARRCTVGVQ